MPTSAPMGMTQPSRIVVTGSSGHVGSLLVRELLAQPGVDSVVCIDVRPPRTAIADPRLRFLARDVRCGLHDALRGVEAHAIVHLAYPLKHKRYYRQIRPHSGHATESLLEVAKVNGIRKVVLCSSTTVYGGYRQKTGQYTEADRLRPNPGYHYAAGKRDMEQLARRWERANADRELVIIRPCVVLGPGTMNYMVKYLMQEQCVVRGTDPELQFIHQDDLVRAIVHLLKSGVRGTFNVTPSDSGVRRSELFRLLGLNPVDCSRREARARLWRRWRRRSSSDTPIAPAFINLMSYPWTASNAHLRAVTGYTPVHSSLDAVFDFFSGYRRALRKGS